MTPGIPASRNGGPEELLIFETPLAAAVACADRLLELLDVARRAEGRATLAVSGGSTPRLMFETLSTRTFDWSGVHIFWVDERCVPPDNDLSNFGMTRKALLDKVPIPATQIHRMRGELKPALAAALYSEEIRGVFGLQPGELPVFDIIQRGMGADAHTASLFPGEALIQDRTGIAAAVWVEKVQQHRLTLLPGVLEGARHTLCLVTGAEKARPLHSVLRSDRDAMRLPAQLVSRGTTWYLDRDAAAGL